MEYFPFPTLDVPLDANADGHSEQFKLSCIVQAGRCGFHCHKSNVTALGEAEGTGIVTVWTSFTRLLEGISIKQKGCWYTESVKLVFLKKLLHNTNGEFCCSLHESASLNLLFNQGMSQMHTPG